MIPIENEKRIDWNDIKAEYIGGASYGTLAKHHGIVKSTIFKKAKKDGWEELRKRAGNEVETETVKRVAETAADNATIAQDLKKRLLLRLQRIEAKYPFDATEIRTHDGKSTVTFRIRDLTAAYKDITADLTLNEGEANELLQSLIQLERRAGL